MQWLITLALLYSHLFVVPPDLTMVPPDAVAIASVRGQDLWKSEFFKFYRDSIERLDKTTLDTTTTAFTPNHQHLIPVLFLFYLPAVTTILSSL